MSRPKPIQPAPESSNGLRTAGLVTGFLALPAGGVLLWEALHQSPGEKPHNEFTLGVILIGVAFGIMAAAWGWFDADSPKRVLRTGTYCGIGAVLAAVIGLFIRRYGMHQIGGFDHSVLVDSAWRLYNGQKAYVDFPCTLPVAFILGAKWAFQWFGVYWSSFVDITALFAIGCFAWSLFLLAELVGRHWLAILWAVSLQAISLMLVSFWWYNPITAVTSVLYVLSATLWLHQPASRRAAASYGFALLVMSAMKPNTAGILVPLISIVLFLSPSHRWKMLLLSAGAFLVFAIGLSLNHLSLTGMVKGYLSVAQRGASLDQFLQFLSPVEKEAALAPAVFVVAPLAVAVYQGRRVLWLRRPLIPLIALAAGFYGFMTNGENKLVDLPLALFGLILLAAELFCPKVSAGGPVFTMPTGWNRYLSWLCVVLAAEGIALGIGRDRVKSIGMPIFFEYDDTRHTMDNGFFKGLHCGDVFNEVNREITAVLAQTEPGTVWFGPRMQWGYAAFNKPSPINQPIWWHPGVAFSKQDEEMYFSRFLAGHPSVLILFKNDASYLSQDEINRITSDYNLNQSLPVLTIFLLKK